MTLNSDSDFAFLQNSNGDITAGGYKLQTNLTEGGVMTNIKQNNNIQSSDVQVHERHLDPVAAAQSSPKNFFLLF